MKLEIKEYEDRKKMVSVLAHNGHFVKIVKEGDKYFIVIYEEPILNTSVTFTWSSLDIKPKPMNPYEPTITCDYIKTI